MKDQTTRLVADLRPEDASRVDQLFPVETRERILAAVLSGQSHSGARGERTSKYGSYNRRWTLAVSCIGALAAAAVVALALGLWAGTPRAFAGWSPTPTSPASGQVASAEAACFAQRPAPSEPLPGERLWHVVLTDTRGPYTLMIVEDAGAIGSCFVGPSPASADLAMNVGGPVVPPRADEIGAITTTSAREGSRYTEIEGVAGSEVKSVTLVLSDGSHVRASLADGWYAAWWPGSQTATAAEIITPNGTVTQQHLSRSMRAG